MHIEPNEPTLESANFDGGDLTEEEARLVAEGLEDKPEITDDGNADEAARAAAEAADAEAAKKAADEQAERERLEQEQRVASSAAVSLPEKPQAPKDFEAVNAANEQAYNDGDIDAVELNRRTRELTLEQSRFERQIDDWERQARDIQDRAKQSAEEDWNTTAMAFEAANKDFLGNPLRHKVMQDSLTVVFQQAQQNGETLTNQQALEKALAVAIDYTSWQPPKASQEDERNAVGKALADRKVEMPGKTLGDMPTSRTEEIRGNEAFASLDALPTEAHEEAYANMTPAQQDRYLRDAPGATANGRGD